MFPPKDSYSHNNTYLERSPSIHSEGDLGRGGGGGGLITSACQVQTHINARRIESSRKLKTDLEIIWYQHN